jgi:hypothetical protein
MLVVGWGIPEFIEYFETAKPPEGRMQCALQVVLLDGFCGFTVRRGPLLGPRGKWQ